MKKKLISSIDLVSIIGERSIKSTVVKLLPLAIGEQYVLLTNASGTTGYHSGIISFLKSSYDIISIGVFAITRSPVTLKWRAYTNNADLKFYYVKRNGIEYAAIKKPVAEMANSVTLLTMHSDSNIFEVVNKSDLTDIALIA